MSGQANEGPELFDRVKRFCFAEGISISEFCRRAEISRTTIERWKTGRRPSDRMRGRAHRVFGRGSAPIRQPSVEDLLL
jgi:transcriptional regulator with XRE-family HTH domain